MRLFYLLSVISISLTTPAFAAEAPAEKTVEKPDPAIEALKENVKSFANGRNLSDYLKDSEDPIAALNEIAKESSGDYAQQLTKNYVSYETATGGRDLSANQQYKNYYDEADVERFGEVYGLNGGNAENTGIPYTANVALDVADQYLPAVIEANPELAKKIRKEGSTSLDDVQIDAKKLEALSKKTKLDPQTIKFILKAMNTGKVTSTSLIKAVPPKNDGASNLIRQNFPKELDQAKRMKASSDRYFAAYKEDMAAYEKFINNMDSDQFRKQFKEYAKYFSPSQQEQAMAPYVNQAKAHLDKAKANYEQALIELKNLQAYLDRFQKQSLDPLVEKSMQGQRTSFFFAPDQQTLPRFSASGIYGFAASATAANSSGTVLGTDSLTQAFAQEISSSVADTSVSSTGKGFDVGIAEFGTNTTRSTSSVSNVSGAGDTEAIAKKDTNNALLLSFRAASTKDPKPMPTNALTRYGNEADFVASGSDFKPLCDGEDKGKKGSSAPATRYSPAECVERMHRLTPFGAKTSDFISLIKTGGGTGARDSSSSVALSETASSNSTFAKLLELKDKGSSTFAKNRTNDDVVLTKGQLNADQSMQMDGLKKNGYDVKATSINTYAFETSGSSGSKGSSGGMSYSSASASGNKEYERFNPVFNNAKDKAEEQAIEQGYCLMVEDEEGPYKISKNADYVPTYDPYADPNFDPKTETRHKKWNLGSGKSASIVRITDTSNWASPRHKNEWQDLDNPLPKISSNACEGKKFRDVCGTDEKDNLNNAHAWEVIGGTGFSSGPVKDYGEYKKPIVDNDGKILVNPARYISYSAIGGVLYWVVYDYTGMEELSCDIAEHAACQIAVLPPVDPENKLKLGYTLAHAEDDGDKDQPTIHTNAYDSSNSKGYKSSGLNWMTNEPKDKFGYNGPWIKSTATGDAGFGGIKDIDREKWSQYMLTAVGMNAGYSPDESNSKAPEANNMSCGTGGWNALVRYQETCARFAGVNCICDYQKALFKGTSYAYINERISGKGFNVSNRESSKIVTETVNGKELRRSQDTTPRLNFPAKTLMSRDGVPVMAQANYPVGGDDNIKFPAKSATSKPMKGLSNAKPDTYITMQQTVGNELTKPEETKGQYKRPWMQAWVESINPTTKCLTVTTKNAPSVFMDSCGNSENLGKVSTFEICPPNATASSGFTYPGGSMPDCAKNNEYRTCKETQSGWDAWEVTNPFEGAGGGLAAVGKTSGGGV